MKDLCWFFTLVLFLMAVGKIALAIAAKHQPKPPSFGERLSEWFQSMTAPTQPSAQPIQPPPLPVMVNPPSEEELRERASQLARRIVQIVRCWDEERGQDGPTLRQRVESYLYSVMRNDPDF